MEVGHAFQLLGDGDLEVVARNRLVECQGLRVEPGASRRCRGVDEVRAGAGAVERRGEIERKWCRLSPQLRDLGHDAWPLRESSEPIGNGSFGSCHRTLRRLDYLVRGVETEIGTVAKRGVDLCNVGLAEHLGAEKSVFVGELVDDLQARLMHVVGGQAHRRVTTQRPLIGLLSVGQPAQPGALGWPRLGQDLVDKCVAI